MEQTNDLAFKLQNEKVQVFGVPREQLKYSGKVVSNIIYSIVKILSTSTTNNSNLYREEFQKFKKKVFFSDIRLYFKNCM